ncbi:MAG: hypothetical protein HY651_00420 [Acidobacteria bacterium]|nr:hypothetical protein [Acidobacteriota bacterium]
MPGGTSPSVKVVDTTTMSVVATIPVGNFPYGIAISPLSPGAPNSPPTVVANTSLVTVNEGQTATNTGTYSDANTGDNVSLTASVGTVTKTGTNSGTWSWSFAATDGPAESQIVTVTADDDNGGTASTDFALSVSNLPPVITGVTGPTGPLAVGTPATVTANFTDAGILDTHTCTFTWDDGTSTPPSVPAATVSESSGSGSCNATHTYDVAGVYTVEVAVKDKDNAEDAENFQFVVVYDPSAGFVTGGGWINSPAGAYAADLILAGKATFGFVSKYQKGATAPTGQTEFQFQVASFNFHSDVYDWLVVAGHKAQYKGTGTVNGMGNYGFLLTATDGQLPGGGGTDKFRIKIWDKATDTVVYDNVGGSDDIDAANPQVIAGGSIVIHNN